MEYSYVESEQCSVLSPPPRAGRVIVRFEAGEKAQGDAEPSGWTGRGEDRTGDARNLCLKRRQPRLSKTMDDTTISGQFDLGSVLSPARAPRPRRTEGTHPDRLSIMRNVETPMGSDGSAASKPTVRKAEFPSGRRRI